MSEGEGADEEVRLTLRLPAILRNRLSNEALRSGRSLNGELVYRLEKTIEDHDTIAELEAEVADLSNRLDRVESRVIENTRDIGMLIRSGP